MTKWTPNTRLKALRDSLENLKASGIVNKSIVLTYEEQIKECEKEVKEEKNRRKSFNNQLKGGLMI